MAIKDTDSIDRKLVALYAVWQLCTHPRSASVCEDRPNPREVSAAGGMTQNGNRWDAEIRVRRCGDLLRDGNDRMTVQEDGLNMILKQSEEGRSAVVLNSSARPHLKAQLVSSSKPSRSVSPPNAPIHVSLFDFRSPPIHRIRRNHCRCSPSNTSCTMWSHSAHHPSAQ